MQIHCQFSLLIKTNNLTWQLKCFPFFHSINKTSSAYFYSSQPLFNIAGGDQHSNGLNILVSTECRTHCRFLCSRDVVTSLTSLLFVQKGNDIYLSNGITYRKCTRDTNFNFYFQPILNFAGGKQYLNGVSI